MDPDPPSPSSAPAASRIEPWLIAAVAIGIVGFFTSLYVIHGFRLPVGPDSPVYLWWTRLAGHDGLSAVTRPGVPAMALTMHSVLGLDLSLVYAAIGATFGAAIGLAAAAFTARGDTAVRAPRTVFALTGVIAGTFAAHLAGGYFANVAWAACILAGATCLATRTTRGAWVAAGLFGAAGLAHPLFWPVGIAILLLATPWRSAGGASDTDPDRGHMLLAAGGATAIFAIGMLSTLLGPRPLTVPTSKDAYLRRAGLGDLLRSAYRTRFFWHWSRYLLPLTVPLAWFGVRAEPKGSLLRRFLVAWAAIVTVGVVGGLLTAWWPPERLLTSAFVLPIGAALGIVLLGIVLSRRHQVLGTVAAGACVVAMLVAAGFTWSQQHPFFDAPEPAGLTFVAAVADAAADAPPGGLVIAVEGEGDAVAFEAARLGNVVRSALPAERIRDLRVLILDRQELASEGVPDTVAPSGDAERDTIARIALAELSPFSPADVLVLTGESSGQIEDIDPIHSFSPWAPLATAVLMLVVLGVIGAGWATWVMPSDEHRSALVLATAPALGAGAVMIAGLIVDRVGLRLDGLLGGGGSILLAAVPGYILWRVRQRPA